MVSRPLSELFLSDTPQDVHLPNLPRQLEACVDRALRLKIDDDAIHTIFSRSSIHGSEWPVYATVTTTYWFAHRLVTIKWRSPSRAQYHGCVIRDEDDNYLGSGSHA
jgi:hypothetical protein